MLTFAKEKARNSILPLSSMDFIINEVIHLQPSVSSYNQKKNVVFRVNRFQNKISTRRIKAKYY